MDSKTPIDLLAHPALLRLAAWVLDMSADEFSNHGCNDVRVEKDIPAEIRAQLTDAELWALDMDLSDYEPQERKHVRATRMAGPPAYLQDSMIMRQLAEMLRDTATAREQGIGSGRG